MRIFIICILIAFTNCSQEKAQIINHKNKLYSSKNYYKQNRDSLSNISSENLHRAKYKISYRQKKKESTKNRYKNQITVQSGDTLYAISQKYHIPNRDLIEFNNLKAPYILKIGQKLKLPSFKYHQVRSGENLYYIARLYDMKISELIHLNNLQKPYNIKVNDKIRVSEAAVIKKRKKKITKIAKRKKKQNIISKNNNRFIWPISSGVIISKFGQKDGGLYNDGINIKPTNNNNILAIQDGKVAYVGNELRGYGNLIIIKHSNKWISAYAHLDQAFVSRGQKVTKGQKIAKVGTTGNVSEKQLYFSLRKNKESVNPELYLK